MKKILVERHPTDPRAWLLANNIEDEWIEFFGEDKERLFSVLDILPATQTLGMYHFYELTDDEYFSVLGRLP